MLASERGYTTILEALLQHNANVEAKDTVSKEGKRTDGGLGFKPRSWAPAPFCHFIAVTNHRLFWFSFSRILLLLQDNKTALILASEKGHTGTVKSLLQHNANVEAKSRVSKEGTEEWTMAWVQTTLSGSCLCFI
jgi:hypothetical protein